jgi:hypothetical protein
MPRIRGAYKKPASFSVDYECKRMGAGITSVDGIPSSFDLTRRELVGCDDRADLGRAESVTHRFWFTPRYPEGSEARYTFADDCCLIERSVLVQLQTEQELLRAGQRLGSTAATPIAKRWAGLVTDALAAGVYAPELTADFRLIELAEVMSFLGVPTGSLQYLLEEHRLEEVQVPRYVGGIRRSEEGEMICEHTVTETPTANGVSLRSSEESRRYRLEYRGGVSAEVGVEDSDFSPDVGGGLSQLAARVLQARPGPDALTWAIDVAK